MKAILFANTDWYLYNFRLPLARHLRNLGFDVLLISPPGPYAGRLAEAGLRWQPLALERRSLNPLRELLLLARLALIYRRERPQIVHHFTIKCVVYGAAAAALAGVPARVNAVAGLGYVFTNAALKARLLRPFVRELLRLAINSRRSRLVLQNGDDVAAFEEQGLADDRTIRLIRGSGVDTSRFRPAAEPALSAPVSRILLASRLLWDKGIAEFVAAARVLATDRRSMRFVLAGAPDPGNPASIPQEQLDAWAAEGHVELVGQVDDMAAELARTDVVVLPSYREGLPKCLLEAAACALPLVATDVAGCRDVVSDGEDGLLVPPRDALALAGAIRALHEDVEWARRLGRAARRKALAEFDERIVIARTVDVYRELLPDLEHRPARHAPAAQSPTADPFPAAQ